MKGIELDEGKYRHIRDPLSGDDLVFEIPERVLNERQMAVLRILSLLFLAGAFWLFYDIYLADAGLHILSFEVYRALGGAFGWT